MADESEAEQDEEEEDEEDATTSLQHMMVGDAPTLPFKDPKAAKLEDGKKLSDKLMAFKKIAQRRVPRSFWVKFIIFGVAVHWSFFWDHFGILDLGCHKCQATGGTTKWEWAGGSLYDNVSQGLCGWMEHWLKIQMDETNNHFYSDSSCCWSLLSYLIQGVRFIPVKNLIALAPFSTSLIQRRLQKRHLSQRWETHHWETFDCNLDLQWKSFIKIGGPLFEYEATNGFIPYKERIRDYFARWPGACKQAGQHAKLS